MGRSSVDNEEWRHSQVGFAGDVNGNGAACSESLIVRSRPSRILEGTARLASRLTSKYFWKVQRDIGDPAVTLKATDYVELSKGRRGALVLVLLAFFMVGCSNDNRPAPKPIVNPDAHIYTTIRILVSDPRIDDVQVDSVWAIGNLGCAPIIYPEGYAGMQQIGVSEQVTKIAGGYQARRLEDRFKTDNCHWRNAAVSVSFMQHGREFASLGMVPDELAVGARHTLICIQPFNIKGDHYSGFCYPEENLPQQLEKTPGKFTVTVEVKS